MAGPAPPALRQGDDDWDTAYYAESNSLLQSGELRLTATPGAPQVTSPFTGEGCDCAAERNTTTGMVASKKMYLYGFFEIEANFARTQVASAFWLQGLGSEISIVQAEGAGTPYASRFGAMCFQEGSGPTSSNTKAVTQEDLDAGVAAAAEGEAFVATGQYHVYGLEWDSAGITLYVDGNLVASLQDDDEACRMDEAMNVFLTIEGQLQCATAI